MSYCNYSFEKMFKILWFGHFQPSGSRKIKLTFDGDAHINQLSKKPDKVFYDSIEKRNKVYHDLKS